MTQKAD